MALVYVGALTAPMAPSVQGWSSVCPVYNPVLQVLEPNLNSDTMLLLGIVAAKHAKGRGDCGS